MGLLFKFIRLDAARRKIFIQAWLAVLLARIGIWVLPFNAFRKLLSAFSPAPGSTFPPEPEFIDLVRWGVVTASLYVPWSRTCLIESLAAEALLRRKGVEPVFRLGAAKLDGKFRAHAWVEHGGKVVFDSGVSSRFVPFA